MRGNFDFQSFKFNVMKFELRSGNNLDKKHVVIPCGNVILTFNIEIIELAYELNDNELIFT